MREKFISKHAIEEAILKTLSMQEAARIIPLSYSVFKRYAEQYGLFKPNQAGKGLDKPRVYTVPADVFKDGVFVTSWLLHKWLRKIRTPKCEVCGLKEWQNKPLLIEIDHKNGNRLDNRLENLRFLCPNCHSQTPNFRSKNTFKYENGCPTKAKKSYK